MSAFLSPLDVRYLGNGWWGILAPFTYHLGDPEGPERVIVPIGFETDFASIPRPLWGLLSPTDDYGKAAVIHDKLYTDAYVDNILTGERRTITRKEADDIFLEAMQVLGVGRWRRALVYAGVRTGGFPTWHQYRNPPLTIYLRA